MAFLIANESHLKISQLDRIGGVYLDILSEVEGVTSSQGYNQKTDEQIDYIIKIASDYRKDIIAEGSREAKHLIESAKLLKCNG